MNEKIQTSGRWNQYNFFWDEVAPTLSSNARNVWLAIFRHAYPDGKSYITRQQISKMTNVSIVSVRKGISELKSAKLIQKMGDMNGYILTLQQGSTGNCSSPPREPEFPPQGTVVPPLQNIQNIQKNTLSPPLAGDGETVSDLKHSPIWKKWAENFNKAIQTNRKTPIRCNMASWALSFYKLHSIDGVSIDEIKETLKWYCGELKKGDLILENSNFLPVALSGDAFRKKYIRIKSAMKRATSSNENRNKNKPPMDPRLEAAIKRHPYKILTNCVCIDDDTGERFYLDILGNEVKL